MNRPDDRLLRRGVLTLGVTAASLWALPRLDGVLAAVGGDGADRAVVERLVLVNGHSREHTVAVTVRRDGDVVLDDRYRVPTGNFRRIPATWPDAPARVEVVARDVDTGAEVARTAPAEGGPSATVGYSESGDLSLEFNGQFDDLATTGAE